MMKKGFTILETLVAISILAMIIIGATGAVQAGLSSYIFSKDQIIAFNLAQEGFEQIRNIRDENRLNNRTWLLGVSFAQSDPCFFGNVCTVDPVAATLPTRCAGGAGNCPVLRQDTTTGFFGYNAAWPATIYRREISITLISGVEVAVSVTVNWSKGSVTRQFKARENLLRWQ